MEFLHNILNLLLPPVTFIFLFLVYPFYLLIKLVIYLHKYLYFGNVSGKVVLITGASSGIGEHLAYEYAKNGANLALVARRKDRLEIVAETSRKLGSANVIILTGDVSLLDDGKKFSDDTILHFGKIDHLINNAGIAHPVLFEDFTQIQDAKPVMASKAALLRLFETLRVELNPDIKITIVFPGFISTKMLTPHCVEKYGSDLILSISVERCANGIFRGIGRGQDYITEPSWIKCLFLFKDTSPEIFLYLLNYTCYRYVRPYFKRD